MPHTQAATPMSENQLSTLDKEKNRLLLKNDPIKKNH